VNVHGRAHRAASCLAAIGAAMAMTHAVAAGVRSGDLSAREWAALAERRIWFGHQSVGGNIMEGVAEVAAAEAGAVRVIAAPAGGGATDMKRGAGGRGWFAHAAIGSNRDPRGKTDAFARRMDALVAAGVEVAFHKYCYADIEAPTDVEALFRHYRTTMDRLRARHPGVTFVHVTTPLQTARPTWRAVVKRWLGRAHDRFSDNAARERFNDLMRAAYGGREPVFDLAAIQSTRPDGTRETMTSAGRRTYALVPAYASDGSHLNERGRRRVAAELLAFLARLPQAPEPRAARSG
jgi:hypothetical protein